MELWREAGLLFGELHQDGNADPVGVERRGQAAPSGWIILGCAKAPIFAEVRSKAAPVANPVEPVIGRLDLHRRDRGRTQQIAVRRRPECNLAAETQAAHADARPIDDALGAEPVNDRAHRGKPLVISCLGPRCFEWQRIDA